MNKTSSPAQIQANRRNAAHSTGPKTRKGKATSRMNALKHATLARQVVAQGHNFEESADEFKAFCSKYYEYLAPDGPLEEMLVDQIVVIAWRLRRVRTAETAEIVLSVDGGCRQRIRSDSFPMNIGMLANPVFEVHHSAWGISLMRKHLSNLRRDIEHGGELTETVIKNFASITLGQKNHMTFILEPLHKKILENPDALDADALRERNKEMILKALDGHLGWLYEDISNAEDRENIEAEASQDADLLPSAQTLDKILRYEGALERQLFRAMNQLERLQRRRLGENVPPPITMDVSARA